MLTASVFAVPGITMKELSLSKMSTIPSVSVLQAVLIAPQFTLKIFAACAVVPAGITKRELSLSKMASMPSLPLLQALLITSVIPAGRVVVDWALGRVMGSVVLESEGVVVVVDWVRLQLTLKMLTASVFAAPGITMKELSLSKMSTIPSVSVLQAVLIAPQFTLKMLSACEVVPGITKRELSLDKMSTMPSLPLLQALLITSIIPDGIDLVTEVEVEVVSKVEFGSAVVRAVDGVVENWVVLQLTLKMLMASVFAVPGITMKELSLSKMSTIPSVSVLQAVLIAPQFTLKIFAACAVVPAGITKRELSLSKMASMPSLPLLQALLITSVIPDGIDLVTDEEGRVLVGEVED